MADRRPLIVLSTVEVGRRSGEISTTLVEEGLAACVNAVPVDSTFRWKGKVESSSETLLVIKTAADCWDRLQARLKELSGYEVPELVAIEPADVASEYLAWLLGSVPERTRV